MQFAKPDERAYTFAETTAISICSSGFVCIGAPNFSRLLKNAGGYSR